MVVLCLACVSTLATDDSYSSLQPAYIHIKSIHASNLLRRSIALVRLSIDVANESRI